MVSATESFCSGNQPFGFLPSKVRQKVAPRWAFQLDLALGRHHHLQPVGDCAAVDRRGWSHQAAHGIEPPGFRDSQRLAVGYGNYWGGSVPLPGGTLLLALFHAHSGCGWMGALEPASFWGSSAPLAGGTVQVG